MVITVATAVSMWRERENPWDYHRLISLSIKLDVTEILVNLLCEDGDTGKEFEARLPGNEWGYFRPYYDIHNLHIENRFENNCAYIPVSKTNNKLVFRDSSTHSFCTEGACYDYPYLLTLGIEDAYDRSTILAAHEDEYLRTSENPETRMMIYKALDLYKHMDKEEVVRSYSPRQTLQRLRSVQKLVPFVVVDRAGMFSEMSEAWRETWGVHWQVGATPWTMSPGYQPCGTSSHLKAAEEISKCMANGTHVFDWVHTHIATGKNYHCRIQLIDAAELGVIGRMVGQRGRECPLSVLQAALDHDTERSLPNSHSRFG